MANPRKSVPENVPGEFFVDSTCIDCDTCRQLAPGVFGQAAETAYVHRQPQTAEQRRDALRAVVSCPTGSIGCRGPSDAKTVLNDFPLLLEEPVYYCGFNSPKSFGGNSYLIVRDEGNWLVDSPKYLPSLARRLEALGGVSSIFLTHRDDVADARRYATHFGARRFIHRAELASQPDAEEVLDGWTPHHLAPDLLAIPTPGHTAGHCVLLFRERFLFTGDHLDWDRDREQLDASSDYCWYSWSKQTESMRSLLNYRFEWVLPGHGQRIHLPAAAMQRHLAALLGRMEKAASQSPA